MKARIQRALDTIQYVCKVEDKEWFSFFDNLTNAEIRANHESIREQIFSEKEFDFKVFSTSEPFDVDFECLEQKYWEAGQKNDDTGFLSGPTTPKKSDKLKDTVKSIN